MDCNSDGKEKVWEHPINSSLLQHYKFRQWDCLFGIKDLPPLLQWSGFHTGSNFKPVHVCVCVCASNFFKTYGLVFETLNSQGQTVLFYLNLTFFHSRSLVLSTSTCTTRIRITFAQKWKKWLKCMRLFTKHAVASQDFPKDKRRHNTKA